MILVLKKSRQWNLDTMKGQWTRFHCIEVLYIFYYYWGQENRLFYQGLCYNRGLIKLIKVPLYWVLLLGIRSVDKCICSTSQLKYISRLEHVMYHGSKLTKSLGKLQLEILTCTWSGCTPWLQEICVPGGIKYILFFAVSSTLRCKVLTGPMRNSEFWLLLILNFPFASGSTLKCCGETLFPLWPDITSSMFSLHV